MKEDTCKKYATVSTWLLQVLNLLLYGLTGRTVDDQLMAFLAVDEHLVDIGDDLVDYEASSDLNLMLFNPCRTFETVLMC